MPCVKVNELFSHYVYGMDARDGSFITLTYDNGISNHPANWGAQLIRSVRYQTYQAAWNRMQQLYADLRADGLPKLVGVSFGIITVCESFKFNEKTAEERMLELNKQYSANEFSKLTDITKDS